MSGRLPFCPGTQRGAESASTPTPTPTPILLPLPHPDPNPDPAPDPVSMIPWLHVAFIKKPFFEVV